MSVSEGESGAGKGEWDGLRERGPGDGERDLGSRDWGTGQAGGVLGVGRLAGEDEDQREVAAGLRSAPRVPIPQCPHSLRVPIPRCPRPVP